MGGADIVVDGVDHAVGGKALLRDVSLAFAANRINIVLGPNGAGKSTLLKIAAGRLAPTRGIVRYDGTDAARIDAATLARRRAFLSQHVEIGTAVSVETVVMMGRYPFFARTPGRQDVAAVEDALTLAGVGHLRDRIFPTLSGGEQQRVQLARVLAQVWRAEAGAPRALFLDEPLTGLDIQHQLQLLDVLEGLGKEDCTIVMTLHDPGLAAERGDRLIFLRDGAVVAQLERPFALDEALVRRVFDVGVTTLSDGAGRSAFRFHL